MWSFMNELKSLVAFAPGTPERRALDLFHAEAKREGLDLCGLCLLVCVARATRRPDMSLESVRDEMCAVLYEEYGPTLGVCYDVLAHPGDAGLRERFYAVESLVGQIALLEETEGSAVH